VTFPAGSLRIERLASVHDRIAFACGNDTLDRYLREQATQDERRGIARVYVAVEFERPERILGFFTLSAAAVSRDDLPPEMAKRLPRHPVPAALVGRLAVDRSVAGRGLGRGLLVDAIDRTLLAAEAVAMAVVVVDPIDDGARRFYEAHGFRSLMGPERRLFLALKAPR
jgi:GNAT superfamily N-acetyltransferase